MSSINRKSRLCCVALATGLVGISGAAMATNVSAARAGIQKTIDNLVAALHRGATAEQAAKLIYTQDAVISVSGDKIYHGIPSFMSTLTQWVKYPPCKWTLEDPIRVSGNLAAAFITETCAPEKPGEKPTILKNLYVFEKRPQGWRAGFEALTMPKP